MEQRNRVTARQLTTQSRRGAITCLAIVIAHALLVHIGLHLVNVMPDAGHAPLAMGRTVADTSDALPATMMANAADVSCGTMQWVAQRLEVLLDTTVMALAVTPLVVLVLASSIVVVGPRLPRLPGPDRQARLQCFQL